MRVLALIEAFVVEYKLRVGVLAFTEALLIECQQCVGSLSIE